MVIAEQILNITLKLFMCCSCSLKIIFAEIQSHQEQYNNVWQQLNMFCLFVNTYFFSKSRNLDIIV